MTQNTSPVPAETAIAELLAQTQMDDQDVFDGFAGALRSGWIEALREPAGSLSFRMTEAGRAYVEGMGTSEPAPVPLAADRFDVKRSGAQVTLVCLRCTRRVNSWPVAGLDTIVGAARAHQDEQHAGSEG